MIVDPPINELLDKVECRYSLVVVVSKRAVRSFPATLR